MKKVIGGIVSALFLVLITLPALGEDCDKAREYFDKAYNIKIEDAPSLLRQEQLYQEAIRLCPSCAEARNNLGDVYEKQGRFEEAIAEYKKAIELRPSAPYPYFGLGDIYYKTNRPKESITWYEKGLRYDPDDTLTRKRLVLVKDIKEEGVIKAGTLRGMLSTTRGAGETVSITFGEGLIPFDFDKYDIRDDARPQLNEIGKALQGVLGLSKDISAAMKEMPAIEIAGHTDTRGMDEYNLELSRRRSEAVVDYLVRNFDLPKDRLIPKGYGERVPLCTAGDTEACHAVNRRVEVIKKSKEVVADRSMTRSVTRRAVESKIVMDVGFFYQKGGERQVKVLEEETRLRSRADKYFIFFRPAQDCYVYILQADSRGKVDLIFPNKGRDAHVKKGGDYWVPEFGKVYTLDDTRGEEKLYLLVTSWPLESEIEGLSLQEQARGAMRALKTRAIYVVKVSGALNQIHEDELNKRPEKIDQLLTRIEGQGGWVKVVRFWHE